MSDRSGGRGTSLGGGDAGSDEPNQLEWLHWVAARAAAEGPDALAACGCPPELWEAFQAHLVRLFVDIQGLQTRVFGGPRDVSEGVSWLAARVAAEGPDAPAACGCPPELREAFQAHLVRLFADIRGFENRVLGSPGEGKSWLAAQWLLKARASWLPAAARLSSGRPSRHAWCAVVGFKGYKTRILGSPRDVSER